VAGFFHELDRFLTPKLAWHGPYQAFLADRIFARDAQDQAQMARKASSRSGDHVTIASCSRKPFKSWPNRPRNTGRRHPDETLLMALNGDRWSQPRSWIGNTGSASTFCRRPF
jgi:hypothetical protein